MFYSHLSFFNSDFLKRILAVILLISVQVAVQAQLDVSKLDANNVTWTTPDPNPRAFMPIGNGEYGLNVWASQNEVYMYISSTSSWGDRLYQNNADGSDGSGPNKLGKIRLVFPAGTFSNSFTQTLQLHQSTIQLTGGTGANKITVKIWVDANNPVIHVEAEGENTFDLSASADKWKGAIGTNIEYTSSIKYAEGVAWYYRNKTFANGTTMWDSTMTAEFGLGKGIGVDPIKNRTYGALMKGDGFSKDNNSISASGKNSYSISLYPLVEQTQDIESWVSALENSVTNVDLTATKEAFKAHTQWWDAFWNRSWIFLEGNNPNAKLISQNYTLQRFMSASAGRGRYPIKFNGSIFLADNAPSNGATVSPDSRGWGPHYWAQNTRLIYWPMLAAGDYEMMQPFFRLYLNALPVTKAQTKIIHGVNGAIWPEVMTIFGTFSIEHYKAKNKYIWKEYTGGLELLTMMLDVHCHTQDDVFLSKDIIPASEQVLMFFEERFTMLDNNGKIILNDVNALESFWDVDNCAPDIAGLRDVLDKLIALDQSKYSLLLREKWINFRNKIPELPSTGSGSTKKLLPHNTPGAAKHNTENPELYSVFPFRIYGKTKPDLELATTTYDQRDNYQNVDWRQDPIWAACLGKTEDAKNMLIERYVKTNFDYKFPTIYGHYLDWSPDQCHANVANTALQNMLIQTDCNTIYLFPSWPAEWDVSFKLNAPQNTTVEVVYKKGEVVSLFVTPTERLKDVVILNGTTPPVVPPVEPPVVPPVVPPVATSTNSALDVQSYVTCFPVPASDYVYIKSNIQLQSADITILNYSGEVVHTAIKFESESIASIKVDNIAPGMYLVRVVAGEKVFSQKIVVE